MVALVDTNILVYRHDARDPRKQEIAWDIVTRGVADRSIRIAYQTVVEFYAAVSRPIRGFRPLLDVPSATRETNELLFEFDVIYPDVQVVMTALGICAAYQLSWYDALLLAYAERQGLSEIISEDFQHGRTYGRVRAIDPFR